MNPTDTLIKTLGEMPARKRNLALFLLNLPIILDIICWMFLGHRIEGVLGILISLLNIALLIMDTKVIFIYGGWWWANNDKD
jgi:hypothetical protein